MPIPTAQVEKFKEYFGDYTNQYVFIGGTACDILMEELGVPFRATKDLDIVLIIEVINASFGDTFWKFIEDGGYEYREKSKGMEQFYRFQKPTHAGYPKMIEIFSRKPQTFELKFESGLTPIHIEESIASLSAILLNTVYYDALLKSKRTVDGYSVLEIETMILFKIKAWIDMKEKLEKGEPIDSKNVKKHKNDIFRLLANVLPSAKVEVDAEIMADVRLFLKMIDKDRPDLQNLGIKNVGFDKMFSLLKNLYLNMSIK
ncbi:MAG: hypothetical protein WBI82_02480 [Sphaerochaeta sp.]